MIQFTVPGEAQAQQRPKFSTVNGHPKAYDPEKSRTYKSYVRLIASQHKPDEPLTGALALKVDIYRQVPKSWSKAKRAKALAGVIRPTTKPDLDNVGKIILDSCNKLLWADDSQVVTLMVRKFYSNEPRVEVEVRDSRGE